MWNDVLGHEEIKIFLKQYIARKEKPHALLFVGPSGLGKRLLAQKFAKALLCEQGTGKDECEACRRLDFEGDKVSHPDFLRVARELNPSTGKLKDISIEQIRELQSKAVFSPVLSKYKLCLIEDVDRMRAEAANCLLKLLEEPPEGWIMVLLAEAEDKLLETILSRVVVLRFHSISREKAKEVIGKLRPELELEQTAVLAQLSEGSIGKALELLKQDVWQIRQQAIVLLEAMPLKNPISYLVDRNWLDKMERPAALLLVLLLQLLLRDMLLLKINVEQELYNVDLKEELQRIGAEWKEASLRKALAVVEEIHRALESNAGIKLTLEAMILKIDKINKE